MSLLLRPAPPAALSLGLLHSAGAAMPGLILHSKKLHFKKRGVEWHSEPPPQTCPASCSQPGPPALCRCSHAWAATITPLHSKLPFLNVPNQHIGSSFVLSHTSFLHADVAAMLGPLLSLRCRADPSSRASQPACQKDPCWHLTAFWLVQVQQC